MNWDDAVLIGCGDARLPGAGPAGGLVGSLVVRLPGAGPAGGLVGGSVGGRVVRLPARPGREHVDPVLESAAPGARLVVAGDDADLAAVVLRLLRTERLGELAVAYLPARRDSAVAAGFGLPRSAGAAVSLARNGRPVPAPLLRDDAGGVLLGRGELRDVRGESYCDEHLVLRGGAARFTVSPDPPGGLLVEVRPPGLARATRTWRGRAVQLACEPARVWLDGVPHPRPVTRWTWYRHTADWLLVRP